MSNNFSYIFKTIIIGDSQVGKSSLVLQFVDNKFKANSPSTVGVEFGVKELKLKDHIIKLQIWDTVLTN